MSRALPVYERFHAWQGEGAHMGKSAFFIRLHGCPVHCPWCDSAGTWHPNVPDSIDRIEPEDLAEEAIQSVRNCSDHRGSRQFIHSTNWCTNCVSAVYQFTSKPAEHFHTGRNGLDYPQPEVEQVAHRETFLLVGEFKVIVETPEDLTKWTEALPMKERRVPVWLHPEWSKAEDTSFRCD